MKLKVLIAACAAMLMNTTAHAYLWTSAVPTQVHMVDGGLLIVGPFDNSVVTCTTGPSAIFVQSSDTNLKTDSVTTQRTPGRLEIQVRFSLCAAPSGAVRRSRVRSDTR